MSIKKFFTLLKDAGIEWRNSRASNLAAAMAYYTMFALVPLLIVAINVAERLFGNSAIAGELAHQIGGWVGPEAAAIIQSVLVATLNRPGSTALATTLSALTLGWAATNLLSHLRRALNILWNVERQPERKLIYAIRGRLLALILVVGMGTLLGLSMAMLSVIAGMEDWLSEFFPNFVRLAPKIDLITSPLLLTVVCAVVYRTLPNVQLNWQDVVVGAVVTASLLTVSKYLISLYLGYTSVQSAYGAAGSLVVLLIWVYYSAQVFLYGAAFTKVYAQTYGSQKPKLAPMPAITVVATSDDRHSWPTLATGYSAPTSEQSSPNPIMTWGSVAIAFVIGLWVGVRHVGVQRN